ncbi:MAG: hypothetical protein M1838_005957 [Thelocarpon superellum]|nr:MAG: hypothetical protein M1838_005957 [Thelocarpon superellum]
MSAPLPSTKVEVSNNYVHVGELSGSALYSAMWNALTPQCPDPKPGSNASCASNGAVVKDVSTVVGTEMTVGQPTFTIDDSFYKSTQERDAMLGAAVNAFQQSASGNKSCSSVPWLELDGACPHDKRAVSPPSGSCTGHATLCNAANSISVQLNEANEAEAAWMNIDIAWELGSGTPAWLEFACELIIDAIGALLTSAAPEVAPEDWALLGEVLPCCEGSCIGGGGDSSADAAAAAAHATSQPPLSPSRPAL